VSGRDAFIVIFTVMVSLRERNPERHQLSRLPARG
jgi:hypothetical protein